MVKGGFENVGTRNYVTMIFHSAQMEAMPFKAYAEDFTTSHPFTASIRATSMTPQDSSFCVRLLNLPSCQIPPGRILTCMSTWETTCIPIRCERHAPVMAAHDDRRGLGAIRSKLIQRNQCQTRLYAPPFWHRQVRTALQVARSFILISLFKAHGRNAWYWARFSLPTEDRRITFTDELDWISTPPAHGRSGIHRGCGAEEHYLSISDCVRQSEKTFQP